jgi:hypothetical protein
VGQLPAPLVVMSDSEWHSTGKASIYAPKLAELVELALLHARLGSPHKVAPHLYAAEVTHAKDKCKQPHSQYMHQAHMWLYSSTAPHVFVQPKAATCIRPTCGVHGLARAPALVTRPAAASTPTTANTGPRRNAGTISKMRAMASDPTRVALDVVGASSNCELS